jgi:hypothetical protein
MPLTEQQRETHATRKTWEFLYRLDFNSEYRSRVYHSKTVARACRLFWKWLQRYDLSNASIDFEVAAVHNLKKRMPHDQKYIDISNDENLSAYI